MSTQTGEMKKTPCTESSCALCLQPRPLRQSHILPEFLYAGIYDKDHRFLQVSTDPEVRPVPRPKGLYERLLCAGCEARVGRWETYASSVLRGGPDLQYESEPGGFVIRRLDYRAFKLFALSLLWRTARSRRPEFAAVSLGAHEERLRSMLDREDPGRATDYGFAVVFPPEPTPFVQTLAPPHAARYQAHHVYRFLLGVTVWLFFVSSHTVQLDPVLISLGQNGDLRVRNGGQATLQFLGQFGAAVTSAAALTPGRAAPITGAADGASATPETPSGSS